MKTNIIAVYLLGSALYGTFYLDHNCILGLCEGLGLPGVLLGALLPGPPSGLVIFGGSTAFWMLVAAMGRRGRSVAIAIPSSPTVITRVWRRRVRIHTEN